MSPSQDTGGSGPSSTGPPQSPAGVSRSGAILGHRHSGPVARRPARRRHLPRLWRLLAIVGPGLIAANAGNDAGGIATYSQAGAETGYELLWALVLITVGLIVVQEMAARLGVATGKGLMALVREEFGVRWALLAAVVVIIANGGTTIAEFAGVAASLQLFGLPPELSAPLTGGLLGWLVLRSGYARVERVFLALGAVFLAYVVTAFLARPDWASVGQHLVVPNLSGGSGFTLLLVAFIGTSITPYMQVYLQSAVADKGTPQADYGYVRFEVIASSILADLAVACIVITTGATLHRHGITDITSAAQAAQALSPLAGEGARYLFAAGLLGASLLAAGVLPLSTAFAVTEAFGTERGVSRSVGEAPLFYAVFIGLLTVGGVFVLVPGLNLIAVLIATQVVEGVLLPVVLAFMLRLSNSRDLMGRYASGRVANSVGGLTALVLVVMTALLLLQTLGLL